MSEYLVQGHVVEIERRNGLAQLKVGREWFYHPDVEVMECITRGSYLRLLVRRGRNRKSAELLIVHPQGYDPTYVGPALALPYLVLALGLFGVAEAAENHFLLLPAVCLFAIHQWLMFRKIHAYKRFAALCTGSGELRAPVSDEVDVPLAVQFPPVPGSLIPAELLEFTHDAIIVWELEGDGILYWNSAAEKLYGFSRTQALGRVTHELLRTELDGSVSELESKLSRYGVWVGELSHARADGTRVNVQSRLALLSHQKRPLLVLEVNRDLTDVTRVDATTDEIRKRLERIRKRPAADKSQPRP